MQAVRKAYGARLMTGWRLVPLTALPTQTGLNRYRPLVQASAFTIYNLGVTTSH